MLCLLCQARCAVSGGLRLPQIQSDFFGHKHAALVGALGITPLDFLLPLAMYIFLRKPVLWKKVLAWILLVFYVIVMILGAVAAIRGIVLDASKKSLVQQLRLSFAVTGPHCCEWVWCMFYINM